MALVRQWINDIEWRCNNDEENFQYKDDEGEWIDTQHRSWGSVRKSAGEESFVCEYCDKWADLNYSESRKAIMIEAQACFNCSFWLEKILWKEDGDVVEGQLVIRVNHQHFVVAPENESDSFRGHAGREFSFKLKRSGKVITTTNLWGQGAIPKHFWEMLPDNAVSV